MTFKVYHVWYQIEGFNTGNLIMTLNFDFGLNWSKVIAKEGQKVIPTYQKSLNETVFKCQKLYQIKDFQLFIYASHIQ